MSPWIIPALRAILPHVGDIVSAARPIFTRTRGGGKDAPASLSTDAPVQQQIAELQTAAAQNDAHIRELAAQLQATVTALEQAAETAEVKARRLRHACLLSMAVSVLAACVSLLVLANR